MPENALFVNTKWSFSNDIFILLGALGRQYKGDIAPVIAYCGVLNATGATFGATRGYP
jgi:hypothetical protein